MYYDSNEEYLSHYGVLGMKWGVRRFQPYSSGQKGKEIGEAKRKRNRIGYDDDVVIKKGTKAYRISSKESDTGDRRYLTVDQNDRNFYKATWPRAMRKDVGSASKDSKIYEQTYRLKEDLISPSAAKRQKIAADLASSKEGLTNMTAAYATVELSRRMGISSEATKAAMVKWTSDGDEGFKRYMDRTKKELANELSETDEIGKAKLFLGAMGSSDAIKDQYAKQIVKSGYNMVIDDHGADFAGNKQRVNAPIIALKADQALEQIGSKKVGKLQSDLALAKYLNDMSTISGKKAKKAYVPNVLKEAYGTKNYYNNPTFQYIYDSDNKRI